MNSPDYTFMHIKNSTLGDTYVADAVVIIDKDQGNMSVTNGIEQVLAKLKDQGIDFTEVKNVIYRDSDGLWDEVKVTKAGEFLSFSPLRIDTLDEALRAIAS